MLFILPVCGLIVVSNCLIFPVLESVLLAEDSIVPAMDGIIMGLWVLYVKTEMGWCNVVLCSCEIEQKYSVNWWHTSFVQ